MKTIKLLKPHTHAGRSYSQKNVDTGVTLTLHDDSADWLVSLGKAKVIADKPAKEIAQ